MITMEVLQFHILMHSYREKMCSLTFIFCFLHAEGGGHLCISVRDYYCYRLQTRPAIFNPILHGGRLFQQWAVDMYIKIEGCRLKWIRDHQSEIRADLYQGIVDSIMAGETQANVVGTRTVLPQTFKGGYRDMKQRHMDAMALVQKYDKPDIFLTMTCNPNWPEIQDELFPGQTAQDRPDLVARVFRAKLETMKDTLTKKPTFSCLQSGPSNYYRDEPNPEYEP